MRPPAFFQCQDIDMTSAQIQKEVYGRVGIRVTHTHQLVQAVATALATSPTDNVEIGLSVAGESFVAPVLVVNNPHLRPIEDVSIDITRNTPLAREQDDKMMGLLNRFGWLVPTNLLKKAVIRLLMSIPGLQQRGTGTFQVSMTPTVDQSTAPMFSTVGILVGGKVTERPVVVNGKVVPRPIMRVTLSADHRKWDGRAGEQFLNRLKQAMEAI